MNKETLRMQMLSGVITESEYKAKLEESKKPLNENFVGMGMVGNIFDREKTDYELAFEHFTKGTSLNENFITGDETVKNQIKAYFEEMARESPSNLASVLTGLVMGEDPTFEDFISRVSHDVSGDDNPFGTSLNELEEANPLEGGPGYLTKHHAGVLMRLISDLEKEDQSSFSDSNLENYKKTLSNLKNALEATKAKYKEETGKDI